MKYIQRRQRLRVSCGLKGCGMEQYVMQGGNPLVGEVTINGAKNAALGILAASIMTDDDVVIENLTSMRCSTRSGIWEPVLTDWTATR